MSDKPLVQWHLLYKLSRKALAAGGGGKEGIIWETLLNEPAASALPLS